MNRFFTFAVGIAILLGIAITYQPTKAQVYDEFGVTTLLRQIPYQELESKNVIPASKFAMPPNFIEGTVRGRSDGFYKVDLPFDYEYNGEVYSTVWICVNGYITFTPEGEIPPQTLPKKNGLMDITDWFFYFSSSYPSNVIAPFMGDHFYRTGDDNPTPWPAANQYTRSEISWYYDDEDSVFTVQWKNLNINYDDPASGDIWKGITSSVGNFQVKIYQSRDDFTRQGDIEFCYGPAGADNNQTDQTLVKTRDAVVGIKGNMGKEGELADFLNALNYARNWVEDDFEEWDKEEAKTSMKLTNLWPPTTGTDYRFNFNALGRNQKEEFWGDGDVDLSQIEGERQGGMDQSRFVTVRDARNIIRSIVTRKPLPRERRREAYHADVNHNGRYILYEDDDWYGWNEDGTAREPHKDTIFRIRLNWKNMYYGDSIEYIIHDVYDYTEDVWEYNKVIPSQISSLSEIYYEATEYDAAIILHYIGGRIPSLPYLLDSIPLYGKEISNDMLADDIIIGEAKKVSKGEYNVPIYLNGYIDGPISLKMIVNGDVTGVKSYKQVMSDYQNDMVTIAGTDKILPEEPLCIVTVKSEGPTLELSDIRLNDENKSARNKTLLSVEESETNASIELRPNPVTDRAVFTINKEGDYRLVITDVFGNVVKTFENAGAQVIWNGEDESGNRVSSGMYIYKLISDGNSISNTLVFTK